MGYVFRIVIAGLMGAGLLGLLPAGSAQATEATTATALNLRDGPSTAYARIATMPTGSPVRVKGCREGWCKVVWQGHKGFASQGGLALGYAEYAEVVEPEVWPIFPAYPYRAGHYPKADWYFDMPPYTAISPKFYRKRFLMMAQERDRYRYVPHIFRGNAGYDSSPIGYVNIQQAGAALRDPE